MARVVLMVKGLTELVAVEPFHVLVAWVVPVIEIVLPDFGVVV